MARLKNFSELSLKKDKDLPNLKIPVQGPKGNSKYTRMKIAYTDAPGTSDIKKAIKAEAVHSADKKPADYSGILPLPSGSNKYLTSCGATELSTYILLACFSFYFVL